MIRRHFLASLAAVLPLPTFLRRKPDVKLTPRFQHEEHMGEELRAWQPSESKLWQCWQLGSVDMADPHVMVLGYLQCDGKEFFYPLTDNPAPFPLASEIYLLFQQYGFQVDHCEQLASDFLSPSVTLALIAPEHRYASLYFQVPEGRQFLVALTGPLSPEQKALAKRLVYSVRDSLNPVKEDSDEARYRDYHAVAGSRLGYRLRGYGRA